MPLAGEGGSGLGLSEIDGGAPGKSLRERWDSEGDGIICYSIRSISGYLIVDGDSAVVGLFQEFGEQRQASMSSEELTAEAAVALGGGSSSIFKSSVQAALRRLWRWFQVWRWPAIGAIPLDGVQRR